MVMLHFLNTYSRNTHRLNFIENKPLRQNSENKKNFLSLSLFFFCLLLFFFLALCSLSFCQLKGVKALDWTTRTPQLFLFCSWCQCIEMTLWEDVIIAIHLGKSSFAFNGCSSSDNRIFFFFAPFVLHSFFFSSFSFSPFSLILSICIKKNNPLMGNEGDEE